MRLKILSFLLVFGLTISGLDAQISSAQVSHIETTNYPAGFKQDLIYFFCDESQIDLSATSPDGTPVSFEWSKYNPSTQTYSVFKTESNLINSNSDNQTQGGYKVIIKDALGKTTHCFKVWVFVSNIQVNAQVLSSNCTDVELSGSFTPSQNFEYYVMPEEPFVIDSTTIIKACFDIEHAQVSDLGFMIYSPLAAGYTPVTIYPHPNNQMIPAQATNCNVGNNVNNLCFSTDLSIPYPVCFLPTPITGTYGWYRNGFNITGAVKYPTGSDNRYLLNGAQATEAGWQIQFFDGSLGNTGTVKEVTLTFINPNPNNFSPDTVILYSGSINFPITDNADKWNTAAKYNLPAYNQVTPTSPITIDYINNTNTYIPINNSMLWGSNKASDTFTSSMSPHVFASNLSHSDTTHFQFTVSDEYGCPFSDTVNYLHQIPAIDSVTINNTSCYGNQDGELIIYSIWAHQFSIDDGINFIPSNLFVGLSEGNYALVVTDGAGCYDSLDVQVLPAVQLSSSITKSDNTCFGECRGTVALSMSGGTAPYTYQWSHTPLGLSVSANLCAGNYVVTITDDLGCDTSISIAITQPAAINYTSTINNSHCITPDGSVTLSGLSGGSAPYQYHWSNGDNDNILDHVSEGVYLVTITDQLNCNAYASFAVSQFSKPQISLSPAINPTICHGQSTTLTTSVLSSSGPFTYEWSHGDVSSFTYVQPDTTTCYTIVVKDQNLCPSDTKKVCVEVLPPIQGLNDVNLFICEGMPLHLNADAYGGNPASSLSYEWNHGLGNTKQVTFTPPYGWPQIEVYEVVISDGCSKNDTIRYTLNFYEPPIITFNSNKQRGCIPLEVDFINTSNLYTSCEWFFGDGYTSNDCGTARHTYKDSGIFDVMLKLEYGSHCYKEYRLNNFIYADGPPDVDYLVASNDLSVFDSEVLLESVYHDSIIAWEWFVMGNVNESDTLFQQSGQALLPLNFEDVFQQTGPYLYYFDDQNPFPVTHRITTQYGCSNEVTKYLEFNKKDRLYVPTAFTPDNDQINDEFYPIGMGINPDQDYEFRVLDRWGNVVFKSDNARHVWNGRMNNSGEPLEQGIYTWHIKYANIKNKLQFDSGSVMLMRKKG